MKQNKMNNYQKFTLTELKEFYNSKHYITEERFFNLFYVRKGMELSVVKEWYKTYMKFPFNLSVDDEAENIQAIMINIIEYLEERQKSFHSKLPYRYLENEKNLIELIYRKDDQGITKNIMLNLYDSEDILTYADIIKANEILLQLPLVDKHYIGAANRKSKDLYFFEGDVYHSKDEFWGNKKGNVYIATGKSFKRLNYIKGIGYVNTEGDPNYDGSEGSFSSYAITGYKYEKMGNIHIDINFLKD